MMSVFFQFLEPPPLLIVHQNCLRVIYQTVLIRGRGIYNQLILYGMDYASARICCYLGFILFTIMCTADYHVWLTGNESVNLLSLDSNLTVEEELLWIFNTTIGHRIRVTFLNFDFKRGYVFLDIGDGTIVDGESLHFSSNKPYTRLASFSGSDLPSVVTTVGNSAWIRLRGSNRDDWKKNFNMTITSTNESDMTELRRNEFTSIKSPNYPGNYSNNFYHLWHIRAPEGFVISVNLKKFDVETGNDHLYVGDGVDRFTNQEGAWRDWSGHWTAEVLRLRDFTSTTSSITMIFTTDYSDSRPGFWIQLQAVEALVKEQAQITETSSSSSSSSSASSPTTATTTETRNQSDTPTYIPSLSQSEHGLSHLISRLIAWISSSILFLIILGCLFVRCRRWYLNRRDDKHYYSAAYTGNVSLDQSLQDAQANADMVDALNVTAETQSDGSYETIPDNFIAPYPDSVNIPQHLGQTSKTDDVEMDESGYMISVEDDSNVAATSREVISVHQNDREKIQHEYFDGNTSGETYEEGDIQHDYQTSAMPTDNFLETSEECVFSFYENADELVIPANCREDALFDRLMTNTKTPHYMNM